MILIPIVIVIVIVIMIMIMIMIRIVIRIVIMTIIMMKRGALNILKVQFFRENGLLMSLNEKREIEAICLF
jgi:hypothetical protein